MSFALLKRYPDLLELGHLSGPERERELRTVYDRDFQGDTPVTFRNRVVRPIKKIDHLLDVETLFKHLITSDDLSRGHGRAFDMARSQRLHWLCNHLNERNSGNVQVFSSEDRSTTGRKRLRTYLLDQAQRYVIILEPFRKHPDYYLITAYPLEARNYKKIQQRYKRRMKELL